MHMKDDILEWHIEYVRNQSDPGELTTDIISRRLMLFNVAAVVTTAAALTHLIFDLYSVPGIDDLVKELREEIHQVLENEGGEWNMRGLNKLGKLDSVIKESMRISSFSTRVCARKVSISPISLKESFESLTRLFFILSSEVLILLLLFYTGSSPGRRYPRKRTVSSSRLNS